MYEVLTVIHRLHSIRKTDEGNVTQKVLSPNIDAHKRRGEGYRKR